MKIARRFTLEDESQIPAPATLDWSGDEIASFCEQALFPAAPLSLKPVEENTLPSWLWRHVPASAHGTAEKSPFSVFRRVVGAATYAGWKKDLFATETEARDFYDEAIWALTHRMLVIDPRALSSVGADWAYGVKTTANKTQTTADASLSLSNNEIDALLAESDATSQNRWRRSLKAISGDKHLSLRFTDTIEEWGHASLVAKLPMAINLPLLARDGDGALDGPALQHVTRLAVILSDLLHAEPAALSIGFCGLAEFLMSQALAYDSPAARSTAAAIASIMTATAVETSALLARAFGTSSAFSSNRAHHLRVIANRRRAAYGDTNDYEHVSVLPLPLMLGDCPDLSLVALSRHAWDQAFVASQHHGLRHTQLTALPSFSLLPLLANGTTPGLLPLPSLSRDVKIADEQFRREPHPLLPKLLAHLGYDPSDIKAMMDHLVGYRTLVAAPGLSHVTLKAKGFTDEALAKLEDYLPRVSHIRQAFTPWVLGFDFCRSALKISEKKLDDYAFDLLAHLGFSSGQIAAANAFCCGHETLAEALELLPEHRALVTCGTALSADALLTMAAAVQCFVTGEIDLTLSLSEKTSTLDRSEWIMSAWRKGLKSLKIAVDYSAEEKPAENEVKATPSLRLRRRAGLGKPAPQSAHAKAKPITTPTHSARSKASTKVVGLARKPSHRLSKTGR